MKPRDYATQAPIGAEYSMNRLTSSPSGSVLRGLLSWLIVGQRLPATLAQVAVLGCSAFDEPANCDRFDEQESEESAVVRVRNGSALTLYFRSPANFGEPFTLQQHGVALPWAKPSCFSCEALVRGDVCGPGALLPSVVAIPSAAHHEFVWPGTLREQRRVPRGCTPNRSNDGSCEQSLRAQHGTYTVVVEAFSDYSCDFPSDCGCSDALAGGACEISFASPATLHETRQAQLEFPIETSVEISFE